MKKALLFIAAAFLSAAAFAQPGTDTTSYLSNHNIPKIALIQGDSSAFTNANIPAGKPVVIIYFSPECGHCQLTAQEIYNDIDSVKDAFFVWVSYFPVPEIKDFAVKYKLAQYDNFKFGRDPRYAIPAFYKVKFTPFMAVYDTQGKLMQTFDQGTTPEMLATLIKKAMAQQHIMPAKKKTGTKKATA